MKKILCKQKHSNIWKETNTKMEEINSETIRQNYVLYAKVYKKIENFKVNQNNSIQADYLVSYCLLLVCFL